MPGGNGAGDEMTPKIVLVCGGRNYTNRDRAFDELDRLFPFDGKLTIITGSANGADQLAWHWFVQRMGDVPMNFQAFPADWKRHGKAAGPIRNQQMIDEGKPDLVVAFPGGKGTADMVRRAKAAGIPVHEVPPHGSSLDISKWGKGKSP